MRILYKYRTRHENLKSVTNIEMFYTRLTNLLLGNELILHYRGICVDSIKKFVSIRHRCILTIYCIYVHTFLHHKTTELTTKMESRVGTWVKHMYINKTKCIV